MMFFAKIIVWASAILLTDSVLAEPWLGNRFAQNCAACHTPARRNVAAAKRRCTLSCQGCHVNPNGGGMRNEYGNWLGKYWLKSHSISALGERNLAPLSKQKYAKQPVGKAPKGQSIPQLVTTDDILDEKLFDRSDRASEVTVASEQEFMARVTAHDPLRLERQRLVNAGGSARYIWRDGEGQTDNWLMALDFGVRVRPKIDYVTAVVETRFTQGPSTKSEEKMLTNGASLRSAYVLVDKLPYNSYVMHGYYRPQFGTITADHTDMAQNLSGFSQASRFKATTIGTAPNVPFFNLHLITPHADTKLDQSEGIAFNGGLRFVTFGASVNVSGWQTKNKASKLKKELYALGLGGRISLFTANFEVLSYKHEIFEKAFLKGTAITLDIKTKLWREYYLYTKLMQSDTASAVEKGKALETLLGYKAFPISGLDIELAVINRQVTRDATNFLAKTSTATNHVQWQAQLFF